MIDLDKLQGTLTDEEFTKVVNGLREIRPASQHCPLVLSALNNAATNQKLISAVRTAAWDAALVTNGRRSLPDEDWMRLRGKVAAELTGQRAPSCSLPDLDGVTFRTRSRWS